MLSAEAPLRHPRIAVSTRLRGFLDVAAAWIADSRRKRSGIIVSGERVDAATRVWVIGRSRDVRAASELLAQDVARLRDRFVENQRTAFETTTAVVDRTVRPHPVMTARIERLSERMGRSLAIEEAKGRLAEQYGITRGDAFQVLVTLSEHSNRKVREVAEQLLQPS